MAHLAGDELPPSFDVVVQGTGVVESILAAAFSRVGKSVLHLDRNAYYGMAWASFMQREMLEWLEEFCSSESSMPSADVMKNAKHMIVLDTSPSRFTNIVQMPSITEDHSTSPLKSLGSKARRLVYDLLPKLLACRGQMVDLLTQSGCSRYLEFKAVSRICIYQSGQVEQVPCSRADVFESKLVSMVEKRKMMKFLSFCAEYKGDSNEDAIDNISFGEYMKKHGLTENLACYVALCIAMTREDVPAEEGLLAAKLFLQSLGRFDNAPFLYPIFGCGELPQAFCRFCAVYGGVYCLKRHVTAIQICTNEDGDSTQLTSVTCSNGQAISCSVLVCPASDVMTTFNIEPQLRLSRGIVVTDGPIRNMHDQLVLLTLPAGSIGPHQVTDIRLLQLPASTNTAVDGTYMFHLTCINQEDSTAEQELSGVTELFFTTTQQSSNDIEQQQPLLLWTLYFNMELCHVDQDNCHEHAPQLPTNMYLTSDPDGTMTYENAMQEAKKIFKRVCPNDEFLPPTESEYTPATE